jgi:hypothetical protein
MRAIVGVMGSVLVDVVVEHKFLASDFDLDDLDACVDGDDGGGSVAAVQVSVTGHSSDLTRIVAVDDGAGGGGAAGALLAKLILTDAEELFGAGPAEPFHDCMLMTGFFCCALVDSLVTHFSSREAFKIWSMLIGLRGGRLLTASDSSLRTKAATTMLEWGWRHFRRKCRIFFRSVTTHGGGLMPNARSLTTSLCCRPTTNCRGRALIR